ncbi:uncharacterized protein LOC113014735 [Astatotilapia calliptera]|uniref:uncharacterized protein LOC113014735 n=1 Tax=Astatotilapia calliptera TaxID=8154 RepID=UPI000E42543F|nr:uncharacterized protein LOC113014735 [Astatotilapia calliptera]
MATIAHASLFGGVVSVFLLVSAAVDQKHITAKSGQKNVTLTCRVPDISFTAVQWSRTDLNEEYVLLYRDEHFEPFRQHPSFKSRVDLQDRQMKDGDVSLILKNVTINDAETYECRVFMEETQSWLYSGNITLTVVDPPDQTGGLTEDGGKEDGGEKIGSVGPAAAVTIPAVLFVIFVFIYSQYKQHSRGPHQPPAELQDV